jgi:hypothetical protein
MAYFRSVICSSLAVAALAVPVAAATVQLRGLALINTDNDQDQLASVVSVEASSGGIAFIGNFSWSTQWTTSLDCTTAYSYGTSRWFSVLGGGPAIATVDAVKGVILSTSPPLSPSYVVVSMTWDEDDGLLYAIGGSASNTIDYVSINATTGVVVVLAKDLGLPFPEACESALSAAHDAFYTVTNDKESDDADQTIEMYNLTTGKKIASIPWAAQTGTVGTINSIGSFNGGAVIATIDDNFVRPLRFWSVVLDSTPGGNVTMLAQLPASYGAQVVIDIGGMALVPGSLPGAPAGAAVTITAVAIDDASDLSYLLSLPLDTSGTAAGPVSVVAIEGGEVAAIWYPVLVSL